MLKPPFKLASLAAPAPPGLAAYRPLAPACCSNDAQAPAEAPAAGRTRLAQLDAALHCSIIGTCLGTVELGKLMARCVDVTGLNDLDIHHEAVRQTHQAGGPVTKALHKALDHKHDAAIRRFAKAHDALALAALWSEALAQGEIPGGYWAVLTHRDATAELRHKAFGDVHMLSHLVGAANRADIRRLEALTRDNAALHERLERQQEQAQKALAERDQAMARLQADLAGMRGRWAALPATPSGVLSDAAEREAATSLVAVQAERRERAEQATASAQAQALRLQEEFDHLQRHAVVLGRELAAAEIQLRELGQPEGAKTLALQQHLHGRRILYVGGRPSSTPAIRDLVLRHGGEFRRHDGGFEDRKGLLGAAITGADLVVFPVDCVDHDSAGNLKRLCLRQGVPFVPMRSASVTSFAAALSALDQAKAPVPHQGVECMRNLGPSGA